MCIRDRKYPYNKKSILGNITSEIVRKKYLLSELPDKNISDLIYKCSVEKNKSNKIKYYEQLTNMIMTLLGGFDSDKFKFKSSVEELSLIHILMLQFYVGKLHLEFIIN